jgi:outer membrane protein OmpA-like peptidoglycan-associated protein/tetratricopeptide (TPR) repeat protein
MKTSYFKYVNVLLLFLFMSFWSKADLYTRIVQGTKSAKASLKEGDTYFKRYQWREAAASYEQALKENTDKKMYATRQVAKAYKLLFDYQNASVWYEKLMEYSSDISGADILDYAELLKNLALYDKAMEVYDLYTKKMQLDPTAPSAFKASCEWAKAHINDKPDYDLILTSLQTQGVFLGAEFYNAGLMYGLMQKGTDGVSYSDLYYSKMTDSVTFSNAASISGQANGRSNDAQPAISPDGKVMYFTKNTTSEFYYNPKKSKDMELNTEGVSLLSIYRSVNVNGEWSSPKRLSFNSKEFSCAYAFIDADGKTLYFSSNRPGGFGGFDLYKAVLQNDTLFSSPENLGKDINTAGDDFAPRVYEHRFYYASRGKGGFGGADIYVCNMGSNAKLTSPQNLGVPFNSPKDDFYILFKNEKEGYFASNRDSEHGEDKFYYFKKIVIPPDTISGIVFDRITNTPIAGVDVRLYELNGKGDSLLVKTVVTGTDGYWEFIISRLKKYAVTFSMKDYYPKEFKLPTDTRENADERNAVITAMRNLKFSPVVKKNNIVKINNIYFDFNKANIRSDSYSILNNLVGFLNENPSAMIELSAHTDAAGNDNYNLKLSNNRAVSCYEYLIASGISKSRIVPKGYGETKLLNNCKDAKKCSEDENQLNRRVEVKFL